MDTPEHYRRFLFVSAQFSIASAVSLADVETIRTLFREYAQWLNVDLCFQNFEAELAGLPGAYAPPRVACSSRNSMANLAAALRSVRLRIRPVK